MANAYHIPYRRVPTDGGGYSMDHYAGVLLFNKLGRLVGEVQYQEPDDGVLAKLQTLVAPATCASNVPPRVDLWSGARVTGLCGAS